jgi:hypothetical protein
MLLEGWLQPYLSAGGERVATLVAALALGALATVMLQAVAGSMPFTRASPDEWVEHVGLNAIGVSTILHVAIGRRWPFTPPGATDEAERVIAPALQSAPMRVVTSWRWPGSTPAAGSPPPRPRTSPAQRRSTPGPPRSSTTRRANRGLGDRWLR